MASDGGANIIVFGPSSISSVPFAMPWPASPNRNSFRSLSAKGKDKIGTKLLNHSQSEGAGRLNTFFAVRTGVKKTLFSTWQGMEDIGERRQQSHDGAIISSWTNHQLTYW
jgi:hypothetical protein